MGNAAQHSTNHWAQSFHNGRNQRLGQIPCSKALHQSIWVMGLKMEPQKPLEYHDFPQSNGINGRVPYRSYSAMFSHKPISSNVQMHITMSNPNRMQGAMTNPATAAAANSTRIVMLDQRFFAKIHSLRRWVEQESQTVVLLFGVAQA